MTPEITIRKSEDRGVAEHGWLHARHSFSFAEYHDPDYMGFHTMRVLEAMGQNAFLVI